MLVLNHIIIMKMKRKFVLHDGDNNKNTLKITLQYIFVNRAIQMFKAKWLFTNIIKCLHDGQKPF